MNTPHIEPSATVDFSKVTQQQQHHADDDQSHQKPPHISRPLTTHEPGPVAFDQHSDDSNCSPSTDL